MRRWYCRRFWPAEGVGRSQEEQPRQLPPGILSTTSALEQNSNMIERDLEAAFPKLPMQQGRPHVAAVLKAHLEQHPETRDVAVFVAGRHATPIRVV